MIDRVKEKLREITPSRWVDQVIGAVVVVVLGWSIAWVADFVSLPREVKALQADMTMVKSGIDRALSVQRDMIQQIKVLDEQMQERIRADERHDRALEALKGRRP